MANIEEQLCYRYRIYYQFCILSRKVLSFKNTIDLAFAESSLFVLYEMSIGIVPFAFTIPIIIVDEKTPLLSVLLEIHLI